MRIAIFIHKNIAGFFFLFFPPLYPNAFPVLQIAKNSYRRERKKKKIIYLIPIN